MALILRNEKGSKLTAAEMDGNLTYLEDRGFPFTGDATIDGTLNIDFTDTLDFFTGQIDQVTQPYENEKFIGDFIGFKGAMAIGPYEVNFLNGMVDGLVDLDEGDFQYPGTAFIQNFVAENDGDFGVGVNLMSFVTLPFGEGGSDIQVPVRSDYIRTPDMEIGYTIFGGEYEFISSNSAGKVFIYSGPSTTNIEVRAELNDESDTFYALRDNDGDAVLRFIADGNLVSDTVLNRDYADDAEAEAAGVPEGGFYHTAGVFKIRLPLP